MQEGQSIQDIFPDMKPTKKNPIMYTINGIGSSIYGKRDFHPETQTYIKTLCLCFLFVPLIPIRSYRVSEASHNSWYFLGIEPLSSFAKWWRRFIVGFFMFVIFAGVAGAYLDSPEYRAKTRMAEAQECMLQNKVMDAVNLYSLVSDSATSHEIAAQDALVSIVNSNDFVSLPIDDVISTMTIIKGDKWRASYMANDKLYERGYKVFEHNEKNNPKLSLKILKYLKTISPEHGAELDQKRIEILEVVVKSSEDVIPLATELALIYEEQQNWKGCYEVLHPRAAKLGITEGARILGQIYSAEGMYEESYALLMPYVNDNLKKLKQAEKAYNTEYESSYDRALTSFNNLYRYKQNQMSDQELQEAFWEYLTTYREKDPFLILKLEEYRKAARVVSVAMDVGLVKLNIARSSGDVKFREKELKEVEKIFLEIQSVAGGQEQYKLTLGQVYYWLGDQEKGQALFDELLEQSGRESRVLLDLVDVMRALGKNNDAYELASEAYENTEDKETKSSAAMMCSLIVSNNDEKIDWLKKSNTEQPFIAAMLNSALGEKALAEGDYKKGQEYIRKTIEAYGKQEQTVYILNNTSLEHFSLFTITGDIKELDRTVELLEESLSLSPQDSIVLGNAQMYMYQKAIVDTIADKIDIKLYCGNIKLSMLSFLYDNEESKKEILEKLQKNPWFQKSLSHLRKSMILAPDKITNYSTASEIFELFQDSKSMEGLRNQLVSIEQYLPLNSESSLATFSGVNDGAFSAYYVGEMNYYAEIGERPDVLPISSSIANTYAALHTINGYIYDPSIDASKAVNLAKKAYDQNISSRTLFTYSQSLLFKAHAELMNANEEYKKVVSSAQRSMYPQAALLFALNNHTGLRKAIMDNEYVKVATKASLAHFQKFPNSTNVFLWALLNVTSKNEGQQIAENIKNSPIAEQKANVDILLSPMSGFAAIESYWCYSALGDAATANKIWNMYAERGVPLPGK